MVKIPPLAIDIKEPPETVHLEKIKCNENGAVRLNMIRGEVRKRVQFQLQNFSFLPRGRLGKKEISRQPVGLIKDRILAFFEAMSLSEFNKLWDSIKQENDSEQPDGEVAA